MLAQHDPTPVGITIVTLALAAQGPSRHITRSLYTEHQ
jgi:hypothetical protein